MTAPDVVGCLDAEGALLGALLHLPTPEATALLDGLPSDAFADPRHAAVADAIRAALAAGERPDPVVVLARLTADSGGVRFLNGNPGVLLAELLAAVPVPGNAAAYRRLVLDAAGRRRRELRHARMRQALDRGDVEAFDELARDVELGGTAASIPPPRIVTLPVFLSVEDEPVRYRVDRLWPVGGRVLLAAQYKAGKTTVRDNLLRALVDDEPFLGRFDVHAAAGRVVVIDNELDERMLRRWLREQDIGHPDRVAVLSLRGRVGSFDLLDPATRRAWAEQLRDVEAAVVLFDCLRPVLDALGLSEDKEAGRFLVAFDALLHEAGVGEAVVVHHMGHAGERSRGDSRLRDWPDVSWTLVREADDSGEQQPDARRYFAAHGRDVLVPEGLLEYDADSRRLTLAGGTRRDTAAEEGLPDLLVYLEDNPGATGRAVEAALQDALGGQKKARAALKRAVSLGVVDVTEGPRRSHLHFLSAGSAPSASGSASAHPAQSVRQCVSAPIGGARRTHAAAGAQQPLDDLAHSDPGALDDRTGGPAA